MKKKHFYQESFEKRLLELTNIQFKLTEAEKISIPDFCGFGGSYWWVKLESKQGINITGIVLNDTFLNASVSNPMLIRGALPFVSIEKQNASLPKIAYAVNRFKSDIESYTK